MMNGGRVQHLSRSKLERFFYFFFNGDGKKVAKTKLTCQSLGGTAWK